MFGILIVLFQSFGRLGKNYLCFFLLFKEFIEKQCSIRRRYSPSNYRLINNRIDQIGITQRHRINVKEFEVYFVFLVFVLVFLLQLTNYIQCCGGLTSSRHAWDVKTWRWTFVRNARYYIVSYFIGLFFTARKFIRNSIQLKLLTRCIVCICSHLKRLIHVC